MNASELDAWPSDAWDDLYEEWKLVEAARCGWPADVDIGLMIEALDPADRSRRFAAYVTAHLERLEP